MLNNCIKCLGFPVLLLVRVSIVSQGDNDISFIIKHSKHLIAQIAPDFKDTPIEEPLETRKRVSFKLLMTKRENKKGMKKFNCLTEVQANIEYQSAG